jgi:hypothetical protein
MIMIMIIITSIIVVIIIIIIIIPFHECENLLTPLWRVQQGI